MIDPALPLIPAPDDPKQWPAFREALRRWRNEARVQIPLPAPEYEKPEFAWAARCFSCCFLMLCDETFCDRRTGRWRVDGFLTDGERRFGGFDAVVLWHAYPRIGLDDRNQFDFYRDAPGGLKGLATVVKALHRRGVRAFVDYNPWDVSTRREPESDADALARLVREIDADGIFLDTLSQGDRSLRAKLDAARSGVALESEIALPVERIPDHAASWAQWFGDSRVPGVLRNKWIERHHMQHRIDRWNCDHTTELQSAWMNGSGMLVWENVFGSWVGWCDRDRSILRAMLPIQRRYARLFCGEEWTPLVPTLREGVYASRWEADGLQLWTLVNRSETAVEGDLISAESHSGSRWFDLVAGRQITPSERGSSMVLSGRIGPRGIGAVLCGTGQSLGLDFQRFLQSQQRAAAIASDLNRFPARTARRIRPSSAAPVAATTVPAGMTLVPAVEKVFRTEFRLRECGLYDPQHSYFTGPGARPLHSVVSVEQRAKLAAFAVDLTPVTNAQYAEFILKSGYRPEHPENFLRHWLNGAPPVGQEDHPVVWVDLDDARTYARWAGKRLPDELEWQFAAEGPNKLRYPWGDAMRAGCCNDGIGGGTTAIDAFPAGRSPFGCLDMCGNVWEWTESERTNGRTRFAILKGGSWYRAKGSDWYFDGGPRPNAFAAKMLLFWPGLDRCATVGFRCAASIQP